MYEGLLKRARSPKKIAEYEAELALPQFPTALAYLWRSFQRLHRRRGSNGFAANPITWPDLDAFLRLSGARLVPWEVEVIEDLDDTYRSAQAQSSKSNDD